MESNSLEIEKMSSFSSQDQHNSDSDDNKDNKDIKDLNKIPQQTPDDLKQQLSDERIVASEPPSISVKLEENLPINNINKNQKLQENSSSIEDDDHLSPLIMDNHTNLDYQDLYKIRDLTINDTLEHPPINPVDHQCLIRTNSIDSLIHLHDDDEHYDPIVNKLSENHLKKHILHDNDDEDDDDDRDATSSPISFEIPNDDQAEKIVQQVEFYFSNENILKDAFLLKHVRRNKDGFVSLKLISSFKRVRQLVKDWRIVGYAIKLKSHLIELNELGTKIRRLQPLPDYDETMPSRTIVATDFPFTDKLTIEKISEIFSKCGEISLVRILRAGGSIPTDVRQFFNKHPHLHEKECAVVEFTVSQSARIALDLDGIETHEMVMPKKKTGKRVSITKLIENYKHMNYNEVERSRGATHMDYPIMIRRPSGEYPLNPDALSYHHHHHHHHNNNNINNNNNNQATMQQLQQKKKYIYNDDQINNRKLSASSSLSYNSRKHSCCSEGYSSCTGCTGSSSDMLSSSSSRRPSTMSDSSSRRLSNYSLDDPFRRNSRQFDFCTCSRRSSQCSSNEFQNHRGSCFEHGAPAPPPPLPHHRRFSSNSMNFERRYSKSDHIGGHNVYDNVNTTDVNGEYYDRKTSIGSMSNYDHRKMSVCSNNNDYYNNNERYIYNNNNKERRISNDSGYDRKLSINSDYSSSPRARSNSTISKQENLVRAPIGPDGSKGFNNFRARKIGQVSLPV